jgi:hypothetical protein
MFINNLGKSDISEICVRLRRSQSVNAHGENDRQGVLICGFSNIIDSLVREGWGSPLDGGLRFAARLLVLPSAVLTPKDRKVKQKSLSEAGFIINHLGCAIYRRYCNFQKSSSSSRLLQNPWASLPPLLLQTQTVIFQDYSTCI